MIKIQFLTAALLLSFHSFSQYNKGQVMLNGNGNFYSGKTKYNYALYDEKTKRDWAGSNIHVGYFLTDHFAIGLAGSFQWNKNDIYREDSIRVNTSKVIYKRPSFGVFMRYNQPIFKSKFGFFLQLNNSYSLIRNNFENHSYQADPIYNYTDVRKEKGAGFYADLGPGIFYFVNNRLSLEANLGSFSYSNSIVKKYNDLDMSETQTEKSSSTSSNFSMSSIYLGVTFYLGKTRNVENENN